MVKRGYISNKTKLAAALRELAGISHEHAKLMHEDQIISLFEFHHIVYHTDTKDDAHYNLDPMLILVHKERTNKIDKPQIGKTRRISKEQEIFRAKMLTPRHERPAKKSRWGSRPFQKRKVRS